MSTNLSKSIERRRKPEAVRRQALEVGRRLLIENGPRAITLKAIGSELGMSHANLIHHFGSAEALQGQLVDVMLEDLTRAVTTLVERHARGDADLAAIVDSVFEAYGSGGVGMLLAWSVLTGETRVATGLKREIDTLVAVLEQVIGGEDARDRALETVRLVTSVAFADSLFGASLGVMLGETPNGGRKHVIKMLQRFNELSV